MEQLRKKLRIIGFLIVVYIVLRAMFFINVFSYEMMSKWMMSFGQAVMFPYHFYSKIYSLIHQGGHIFFTIAWLSLLIWLFVTLLKYLKNNSRIKIASILAFIGMGILCVCFIIDTLMSVTGSFTEKLYWTIFSFDSIGMVLLAVAIFIISLMFSHQKSIFYGGIAYVIFVLIHILYLIATPIINQWLINKYDYYTFTDRFWVFTDMVIPFILYIAAWICLALFVFGLSKSIVSQENKSLI